MKKTDKLKRYITNKKETKGITLIALVITIVLNSSYLAMERKNRKETNKLKI